MDVIDDKTGAVVVYQDNLPRIQGRFAELESHIADDLTTIESRFYRLGCSLCEIRDDKLYLETHKEWGKYCRERWDISRIQAHRLIVSSQVINNLLPMGNSVDVLPIGNAQIEMPVKESQIRPLTILKDPAKQREAWQKAVETAPDGKVTARHVNRIVKELRNQTVEESIKKRRVIEDDGDDEIDPEIRAKIYDFIRFLNELSLDRWKRVSRRKAKLYLDRVMTVFKALP